MKSLRKIMALLIAMVMVLGMSVVTFAAEGETSASTTYTIKITAPAGHTYEVYQIFTGTPDGEKLTSLKYGRNARTGKVGDAVSQTDMTAIKEISETAYANDQAKIDALKSYVNMSNPVATVASETATEGLAPGYYVIKDKDNTVPDDEGATLYMFKVLKENLEITAKSDKPSSDKKVDDINDSNTTIAEDNGKLQETADYDIGDDVPYTLTFTLPSDYANYEHYYVKFYDDMCKALTYKNGSAMIKYGSANAEKYSDPVAGTSTYTDGHMWTWEIMDLKAVNAAKDMKAGDMITLTYNATLNNDAIIGLPGNDNKMYVEFSNNPNKTGDGTSKPGDTGKTPTKITFVLTYETTFNKVDEDENPLTGADFKLEKKVGDKWVDVTTLGGEFNPRKTTNAVEAAEGVEAKEATSFTFTGLDDGMYKITETKTPAGYNSINPIEFSIKAGHVLKDTGVDLTSLEGTDGKTFKMTAIKETGNLTSDIENKSGSTLPSTGGMGTTLFYIVGGILVAGAAIILIAKRKVNA